MSSNIDDWPRLGVGMMVVHAGKVLLVQRRKRPEAGHWGILGGKLEKRETLLPAAIREAEEESGLEIGATRLIGISEQLDIDGQHWVAPIYLCEDFVGEAFIREPHAHQDMGWFALDGLPSPLTWSAREAIAFLADLDRRDHVASVR